jgi:hypothetical protein
VAASFALATPAAVACGARTGVLPLPTEDAAVVDAADAGADGNPDAGDADAADARDAPEGACADPGMTQIYVITKQARLYTFYPPTLAFQLVGTVECSSNAVPFSMAVARGGTAFLVLRDGTLFRVDTSSAACAPTTYATDQLGFLTFGMGYVSTGDAGDAGETLYVAEANNFGRFPSKGLATIDTATMTATSVGSFSPSIPGPELTGTGTGRLFALYTNATPEGGSHIAEVDPTTGRILNDDSLMVGANTDGYAFAFWGGDFWIFTAEPGGPTTITRFDPTMQTETMVGSMNDTVVGAGVSTCAPH